MMQIGHGNGIHPRWIRVKSMLWLLVRLPSALKIVTLRLLDLPRLIEN
jgi:hypothetical protein